MQSDFLRYREQGRLLVQAAKTGQSNVDAFARDPDWLGYSVFKTEGGALRLVLTERKVDRARELGIEGADLEGLLQVQSWASDRDWVSNGVTLASVLVRIGRLCLSLGLGLSPSPGLSPK